MATNIYDAILNNKFKRWFMGTPVMYTGPDETRRLFEVLLDQNNDGAIKLPFVCLRRQLGYSLDIYGKKPLTFRAFRRDITTQSATRVNAIPIKIDYQVDVYARYFEEADDYMRNIVFNIINYPHMEIEVKYQDIDFQHSANILPKQEVVDNSGIAERLVPGQFTRLTYEFSIDDAYLWDVRKKDTIHFSIGDLHIIDKETEEDIVEELDFGQEESTI